MKNTLIFLSIVLLAPLAALHAADAPKPNIVFIFADDWGWGDLSCHGSTWLKTPNLDTLVTRGFTFTHCYTMGSMVGAVCTPSRTMMLTGRSWQRIPKAPATVGRSPRSAREHERVSDCV